MYSSLYLLQSQISNLFLHPSPLVTISLFSMSVNLLRCPLFFFLAVLNGLWDLSSLTRGPGTESMPPAVRSSES